ncbi:hypothetical protein GQ53DRAFT_778260 [Thozetella sp. PMI_491]|nr:hypothetical protein GQ53DRAFT_778260 [Thozetella sp. PMI_491]
MAAPSPSADFDATMSNSTPLVLLDLFFPGFSPISGAVYKYLHIDLNVYIPLILLCGGLVFLWRYFAEYLWGLVEKYLMSVVDIRVDDEIYNMLMTWVASQGFSQGARRFVVNTSLNSRSWYVMWNNWREDDEADDEDEEGTSRKKKKKALAYTPTFGSHWFWYQGRLLIFRRSENRETAGFLPASEREEISVSCFGRDPWVLKELLHEAREAYVKRDEQKTLIYRGAMKAGSGEPVWQRSLARASRPFSTVILNEKVKEDLIEDVRDYLNPMTRRWYSNRGIPYRRGYLLHGPPGTGKSSLSLALAGHFKMRIYIVSLSSVSANEENLASLFAELPRRCVVLLEDIDTAGLTHTREETGVDDNESNDGNNDNNGSAKSTRKRDPRKPNNNNGNTGRLSLSGLLNILDGVASQEGRVLIMTTNHIEKLDKALIRPGRVDMIVKFGKADEGMIAAIFRAIYAPLEGDDAPVKPGEAKVLDEAAIEAERKKAEEAVRVKAEVTAKVEKLALEFGKKVPAHEFSPAEIQGFLLKNKRTPERAVDGAEEWVVEARKEKKEKELKEAEEKRKKQEEEEKAAAEEEKKEAEEAAKKKEEEEKEKRKEARRKARKSKSHRRSKRDAGSDSDSSATSESESEVESSKKRDGSKKPKPADKTDGAELYRGGFACAAPHRQWCKQGEPAMVVEPSRFKKTDGMEGQTAPEARERPCLTRFGSPFQGDLGGLI